MEAARVPTRAELAPRKPALPANERASAPGRQSLAEVVAPSKSRAFLPRPWHRARCTGCEDLLHIKGARCFSVLAPRSQRAQVHFEVDPARRQVPVDSRPATASIFPRSQDGRSAGHRLCHFEDSRRHQDRRPWTDGANVAFPAGIAHSQFRAPARQINFQSGTLEEEPIYQVVQLQALALDFGARASPLTFTKFMKSIGSYLRRQRIGTVIYIDDLAFIVEGYEEALRARTVIEDTLQRAGLEKHATKGQWQPSQVLNDHLGYEVNVPANALRIPERRCATIRRLAVALRCEAKRGQRFVPTRLLQQFTGTAQSTSKAVPRFQLQ